MAGIGIVLIAAGFWGWKTGLIPGNIRNMANEQLHLENDPKINMTTPTSGQIETASKQPYVVVIESQPQGARVYIDGQDSGMITPTRKVMDADKEFTVGLRLDGYQYYERKERAVVNGYQVRASLLPAMKMGYLNLDILNGGSNPVIIINGQRIEEKLPLVNYAVPAGVPVKIQAHNPFTGLTAEQVVKVPANQKIQVNLILSQRQPSSHRKK
jgi:hypothetical protein